MAACHQDVREYISVECFLHLTHVGQLTATKCRIKALFAL
jgi:hypothetical protein